MTNGRLSGYAVPAEFELADELGSVLAELDEAGGFVLLLCGRDGWRVSTEADFESFGDALIVRTFATPTSAPFSVARRLLAELVERA